MIADIINNKLQNQLDKKKQEVVRLRWEKLKLQKALEALKEQRNTIQGTDTIQAN